MFREAFLASTAALRSRSWDALLEHAAELRRINPKRVEGWARALIALRELGRFAEAETLLAQAPAELAEHTELRRLAAWLAQRRGDWNGAADRWLAVSQAVPDNMRVCVLAAAAARLAGRFAESERILAQARALFAPHPDMEVGWAATATGVADLPEAERRWQDACARFPDHVPAIVGYARMALGQGRAAFAEELLARAAARLPGDREIALLQARAAMGLGDWTLAVQRWREVTARFGQTDEADIGLAESHIEMADFDTAERILAGIQATGHAAISLVGARAKLALRRGDVAGALALWQAAYRRHPESSAVRRGLVSTRMRLLERAEAPGGADEDAAAPLAAEAGTHPDRALFEGFESLGDSCEFGFVQRAFGAEPLGLLRWASIPPDGLIDGLEADFAGVGDPAQTTLEPIRREYWIRDTSYNILMHSFIEHTEASPERLLPNICQRLAFLRRKLLEDIEAGEKIFVYRSRIDLGSEVFGALHAALCKRGPRRLLIATLASDTHPAGSVHALNPNCLVGRLAQFHNVHPWLPGWQALCTEAKTRLKASPHSG
jgi:predicted Zn-dependent protease